MRDDVCWIFSDALLVSSTLVLRGDGIHADWQTRRQEWRKHTEKKNKKDTDNIRNNENYELLATDKVRREYVTKNKECVFLTVKIGHRVRYIFADVKVNTEISTTPKTNTQLWE
jgi:hypothetical protein